MPRHADHVMARLLISLYTPQACSFEHFGHSAIAITRGNISWHVLLYSGVQGTWFRPLACKYGSMSTPHEPTTGFMIEMAFVRCEVCKPIIEGRYRAVKGGVIPSPPTAGKAAAVPLTTNKLCSPCTCSTCPWMRMTPVYSSTTHRTHRSPRHTTEHNQKA